MTKLLLTLALISLLAGGVTQQSFQTAVARSSITSQSQSRLSTNYDAKQAFARLILHLRNRRKPLPTAIWNVAPGQVEFYGDATNFLTVVREWVIEYPDKDSDWWACVNCWGEVTRTPIKPNKSVLARRS